MYTRNEKIVPIHIEEELKDSYISYAMSVIVGRALPDARDGLKPVHRRILYAMKDLNLEHSKPYKKCARIVGECFVKDTLVLAEKGLIPIQNVCVGDMVYTHSGAHRVTALYEMPPKQLLKVSLENGSYNEVTPSQKFKVLSENWDFTWKEAKDLTEKDYIIIKSYYPGIEKPAKLEYKYKGEQKYLNKNLAYLLGFFVSEGWISNDYSKLKHPRIGWGSTAMASIEKIADILMQEFDYLPTIEKKPYKIKGKNGFINNCVYSIRINRLEINEFFVKNFDFALKNAFTKEIPRQIFISPKEVIFSFVSGMIEGDGSVHSARNVIHYGSVSRKLIKQLGLLLQHLGIFSTSYTERHFKKARFINSHPVKANYRFKWLEIRGSSALLLAKNIQLCDTKKQARLQGLLRNRTLPPNYDTIPYGGEHIFKELSACHIGSGWYKDTNGQKFRMGIKYPDGCKIRYSSDLAKKPLRKSQICQWGIMDKLKKIGSPLSGFVEEVAENNIYFLKVSSVKSISAQKTYDLQVEGAHEFVANGMLAHNCLGKYHPHGDIAVYDTLVRMAQDFSLRYPLVDGQGNFGSVDGDPPAAQRYTEARLAAIADEMLSDLEKDSVEFMPNFDETLQEPRLLPAVLPNLLANGSSGIAVGMATNIPPHNLTEIADAIALIIDNPQAELKELMKIVKGPDFPTGGIICGREGIKNAYSTGRGLLKIHAKANIESVKGGRERIVVTEIPYQVNKSNLISSIADLVGEKKLEGISDIRDESDKDGMRMVIELKRDANAQVVLNQLYKHTQMQETFGVIMLALVENRPRVLTLRQMLDIYIEHRKEIVIRRTKYDLKKAQDRAHILEGFKIAIANIDKIIALIKKAKSPDEAREELIERFDLSGRQAQAILEMQLQRLTGLERDKIEAEYLELIKKIEFYKSLLGSEKKILQVIKEEILEIKKKYGDERRTQIAAEATELDIEDLIAEEDVVITISHTGYIKRLPVSAYRKQRRGGKGVTGAETREEDFIEHLFIASTHDYMLFFTNIGKVHWLKVHEIPQAGRISKGKAIINMLEIAKEERVTAFVPVKEFKEGSFLVMVTKLGLIKKTDIQAYSNPRKGGIIGIGIEDGDELIQVLLTDGKQELLIATKDGKAIRFNESDVRDMGRGAKGVKGVTLAKKDVAIGVQILKKDASILTVTINGFGKRTDMDEYRVQLRGGKGVINIKTSDRNGEAIGVLSVTDKDEIMLITEAGMIVRCPVKDLRETGRSTQGVRLMRIDAKDKVSCVAPVVVEEEVEVTATEKTEK